MVKQKLHKIDKDIASKNVEKCKEFIQFYGDKIRNTKVEDANVELLVSNVKRYVECLSALEPDNEDVCYPLRLLTYASTALFTEAMAAGERVELKLDDDFIVQVPVSNTASTANVLNWRNGFYAAMVRRDREALDILANVPVELLRNSSSRADECQYLYVAALQAMWKRDPETITLLLEAVRATDPQELSIDPDYVLNVLVPEMELFYRFVSMEEAEFNETLTYALESHKRYWSQGDQRLRSAGFIAWGILGIASLAYDVDFAIEMESEYMPEGLLKGMCRR